MEDHERQDLASLITTFDGKKVSPKPNKKVRPWKHEEDELLKKAIEEFGTKRWHLIAERVPNRTRKQCRERYCNHLDPDIVKKPWTAEEDEILKNGRAQYGNKWAVIKCLLPGRTANQIKNRYFSKHVDEEKPQEPPVFVPASGKLYSVVTFWE